jgi:hypothetical protein
MEKAEPHKIGSVLKHRSGVIIKLTRYGTQLVPSLHLSIDSSGTKRIPNYNYLYGTIVDNDKSFEGLTEEFELLNP